MGIFIAENCYLLNLTPPRRLDRPPHKKNNIFGLTPLVLMLLCLTLMIVKYAALYEDAA